MIMFLLLCAASVFSSDVTWDKYKTETLTKQNSIPGWCCREKAEKMMDLIHAIHPTVCVEIGVFGGSSIYPTASALKYEKAGKIYAIDPWAKEECTKGYVAEDPNYEWWSKVNLEKVFCEFKKMLESNHLTPYCAIMRMTSVKALSSFQDGSIDILHIDGNHSEDVAFADIEMFLPKVKSGGYIWFDDVDWVSTNKAVQYLSKHADVVNERSIKNACLLFKKR